MIPKFRAWDKDSKVMRSWKDLILTKDDGDDFWLIGHKENACITSFDHEQILMQSTGLKDKNGVEIFEGDVFIKVFRTIEIPTGKNGVEKVKGVVKFHAGAFKVYIDGWGYDLLSDVLKSQNFSEHIDYWEHEIVGNIYENPELLSSGIE